MGAAGIAHAESERREPGPGSKTDGADPDLRVSESRERERASATRMGSRGMVAWVLL